MMKNLVAYYSGKNYRKSIKILFKVAQLSAEDFCNIIDRKIKKLAMSSLIYVS